MERPYIICHMTVSLDGKVTGDFLSCSACERAVEVYYEINRAYAADAYACGKVTMEGSFTGGWTPDLSPFADAKLPREDYVADPSAAFFAVAFDRRGRLGWKTGRIEDEDPGYGGAHIVEVLCEDAADAYLAYLRSIGVSYLFAGERELDLPLALMKLKKLFGIERLLLEGGSEINGAFQRERVVDALSLVVAPMVAGEEDKPLFTDSVMEAYALSGVKQYDGGILWLNYQKKTEEDDHA